MYTGEKLFLPFFARSFFAIDVNCARLFGDFAPTFLYRSVRYVTTRDPA